MSRNVWQLYIARNWKLKKNREPNQRYFYEKCIHHDTDFHFFWMPPAWWEAGRSIAELVVFMFMTMSCQSIHELQIRIWCDNFSDVSSKMLAECLLNFAIFVKLLINVLVSSVKLSKIWQKKVVDSWPKVSEGRKFWSNFGNCWFEKIVKKILSSAKVFLLAYFAASFFLVSDV